MSGAYRWTPLPTHISFPAQEMIDLRQQIEKSFRNKLVETDAHTHTHARARARGCLCIHCTHPPTLAHTRTRAQEMIDLRQQIETSFRNKLVETDALYQVTTRTRQPNCLKKRWQCSGSLTLALRIGSKSVIFSILQKIMDSHHLSRLFV